MKISVGWINSDGFSENQEKSFKDEDAAFDFCRKHISKIARINGERLRRESDPNQTVVEITDDVIRKAIKDLPITSNPKGGSRKKKHRSPMKNKELRTVNEETVSEE